MKVVEPKVFLVGATKLDVEGLRAYLAHVNCEGFWADIAEARDQGLSDAEILCSTYAKLCYAALDETRNKNLSRVRSIPDNIRATIAAAHGSVFENAHLHFIAIDVSRVFTHELVRQRAGWGYAQTSGRYVRTDELRVVLDPILEGEVREGVKALLWDIESRYNALCAKAFTPDMDFGVKKKLTSALRRVLPNGLANEIAFSVNLRALRHFTQLRTSRHAEREMRIVAGEVYQLTKAACPLLFHDAKEAEVDGLLEVSGMRTQPYEPEAK